jgi:hypothetical protein
LHDGDVIVVPHKGATTIYVKGAVVEPKVVVLRFDEGPREAIKALQMQEGADLSSFLRRKSLKNGSVIEIKMKKQRARTRF